MKTYAEWSYNYAILDLGTRWKWVVSFTPLPLYRQENTLRYPLDGWLGGPRSRCERCWEKKNLALRGMVPRRSSPEPVTVPTELSRLQHYSLRHHLGFASVDRTDSFENEYIQLRVVKEERFLHAFLSFLIFSGWMIISGNLTFF
jgi:hypothetical protein